MAPIDGLGRVGIGLAGQQGTGPLPERRVLFLSLTPRKSPLLRFLPCFGAQKLSPGPDGGGGGSSSRSIRSSEALDAQACSRVPFTEKCSSLSSG